MNWKEFADSIIAAAKEYIDLKIEQLHASLPAPKDGAPGKDGSDGKSIEMAEVVLLVEKAVSKIPAPKGGKDGADGRDGVDGKGIDGLPGAPGKDGKDGKSIEMAEVEAMLDKAVARESAKWALDFERRAQGVLQGAIDKMPVPKDGKDGVDGRDALDLDDMAVSHDDDGNVTFKFTRGAVEKTFSIRLPRFKDQGVYAEGFGYKSGDGVSSGGCFWIAQKDSPLDRPGTGDGWRMAVKKGRDGKDGVLKAEKTEPYKLHGAK